MTLLRILISIMLIILTITFAWNAPKEETGSNVIIVFSFALATALATVFMWV
jgi:hypothetical protein|nr:MAG TPA: conjugal transfer protein [Bacteriophage sp.]DAZ66834.1 MAG TPA: conjugal transfer protein [Caudoviricetes sp.]